MDESDSAPDPDPSSVPVRRGEPTQSVRFDRQPDGHFRAVLVNKPPKSLAEIMTGLLRDLPPAVRDASPPAEASTCSSSTQTPLTAEASGRGTEDVASEPGASNSTVPALLADRKKPTKSVRFARQPDGHSRAILADKPSKTLAKVTAGAREELLPVVRDAASLAEVSRRPRPPHTPADDARRNALDKTLEQQHRSAFPGSPDSAASLEEAENVVHLPTTTGSRSYSPNQGVPEWYKDVTALEERELKKRRPQEITALGALKACIASCERAEGNGGLLGQLHEDLRDHVHKAEVALEMDKAKAKITKILTEQNGLPRIFTQGFPADLRADAFQLYGKWWRGDFDRDLLRGIFMNRRAAQGNDRVDPTYKVTWASTPRVYGDNGLVVGQWWPTQMCAIRDKAHGPALQGGKSMLRNRLFPQC
jgi:hypothetical protein